MATIKKQKSGSYKITVSNGYDTTGKQIRYTMTYTPDPNMTSRQEEKAVQREATLFEEKCKKGNYVQSNIKFADFADLWFQDRRSILRPKTYERYKSLLPRINAAIGHMRLDRIQPLHLRQFYDNLAETGVKQSTKYKIVFDFNNYLVENGLSIAEFSRRSGISKTTVSSFKHGKNVNIESAQKFCNYLQLPLNKLFIPIGEDSCLSAETILYHHRLISSMLSDAVEWGILESNPCSRTKPPKTTKKNPRYLDEFQAEKLLTLIEQESAPHQTMVRLLLFTGLRRGELLGLEWKDIDYNKRVISICRTSQYTKEKGVYTDETKNETSIRTIKIPPIVVEYLKEYNDWQSNYITQMGDRWHETDRLFTTHEGIPVHPDSVSSWFGDFIKTHQDELPYISIHSLRHTNATLQVASGVPLTTIAYRLGHANPTTTSKIYAHAIKSADEAAAEALENILVPNQNRREKSAK